MTLERRDPFLNDPPYNFQVHAKILVDEHVPKCPDATPRYLRMLLSEI
jgi:hypothetical protein